jgi:hypothetical protein
LKRKLKERRRNMAKKQESKEWSIAFDRVHEYRTKLEAQDVLVSLRNSLYKTRVETDRAIKKIEEML